jgi:hypothetical protein
MSILGKGNGLWSSLPPRIRLVSFNVRGVEALVAMHQVARRASARHGAVGWRGAAGRHGGLTGLRPARPDGASGRGTGEPRDASGRAGPGGNHARGESHRRERRAEDGPPHNERCS